MQQKLFGSDEDLIAAIPIPGLRYLAEVISSGEERELLAAIDNALNWSSVLRRRVQHYGYRYDYRSRKIDESMRADPFPLWLSVISKKLYASGALSFHADQAIVNEYLPGQGIASHLDCEPCFGAEVASLSLGSGCEMQFGHLTSNRKGTLYLDRRSIVVMRDAARYEWKHGIPARLADHPRGEKVKRSRRVSITFRTVIIGR